MFKVYNEKRRILENRVRMRNVTSVTLDIQKRQTCLILIRALFEEMSFANQKMQLNVKASQNKKRNKLATLS